MWTSGFRVAYSTRKPSSIISTIRIYYPAIQEFRDERNRAIPATRVV